MIADGPGEQHPVARANGLRRDFHARRSARPMPQLVMYMPSALPCSTTLVSPPAITTPARRAAAAMARTSASRIGGQSGFENESHDQASARAPGHRQVVYRAVHRQFADGAAGKTQGLYHEAIGGDG